MTCQHRKHNLPLFTSVNWDPKTFEIWTVGPFGPDLSHCVSSCDASPRLALAHPMLPYARLCAAVAVCWWLSVLSPVWGTQGWRSVPPASLQPSSGPGLSLRTTHAAGPPGAPEQGATPVHPGPFGEWEQVRTQDLTEMRVPWVWSRGFCSTWYFLFH